jgi:hypothetical protein
MLPSSPTWHDVTLVAAMVRVVQFADGFRWVPLPTVTVVAVIHAVLLNW